MNLIGNSCDKSCGHDLRPSKNRQGLLADLRPSSPAPPRAAAVAHLNLSREHRVQALNTGVYAHFRCMPAAPSCPRTMDARVPPTGPGQEHPLVGGNPGPGPSTRQPEATPFGGALEVPSGRAAMASGDESADLLDSVVNHLFSDDYEAYDPEASNVRAFMADYEAILSDTIPDTGAAPPTCPAQGDPPVGESVGHAWSPGQIGASLFDWALEEPSGQTAMASGDESADLLDLMVNRLLSDDYEAYDPEAPNALALMADYEAAFLDTILNTDVDLPAGPDQKPPFVGESPGPARATGQMGAPLLDRALEDPSGRERMASGGERAKRPTEPLADPDHAREKKRVHSDYILMINEQRRAISHIFETDPERSNQSIADEFGVTLPTIKMLRKKFDRTGDITPGDSGKRLSVEQRRAISHIFETDPERGNQSITDEVGVSPATIKKLREQFSKTGDITPGDSGKRLSVEQRRVLLHIFKTDLKRGNQRIADEVGVSLSTIKKLRVRFNKTGDIKLGDPGKHLSVKQRRAISDIFETDPERSNQSLADEFGVFISTIKKLRKQYSQTGDIKPGNHAKRLSADQRRAILHIFETDPKKNNQSLADEFGISIRTIQTLRKQFGKTGDIKPGDSANRLSVEQRRAIMHIFKADPKRGNQRIADEVGTSLSTIKKIRERFGKTGDIKPGDSANRLSAEQRRALLHIFETDPERTNQRIVDEFGVTCSTIKILRERFSQTGDIKPGNYAKRLTGEQRQAILHILKTDPKRTNQSLVDEFGISLSTIKRVRRKFGRTGNIKPGDYANRLTGDQRQAILHMFETNPGRRNHSIAEEFDVSIKTIQKLRKKFGTC